MSVEITIKYDWMSITITFPIEKFEEGIKFLKELFNIPIEVEDVKNG
jgi:hypothetical protein